MGRKLKQIVQSLAAQDGQFLIDDLHRILEKQDGATSRFTGYYADEDQTVYTTKAWSKMLLTQKKAAQAERLEAFQEEQAITEKRKKNKVLSVFSGVAIMALVALGIYLMWPSKEAVVENEPIPIQTIAANEFSVVTIDSLFGNAQITGENVNMRAAPSLEAAIVDFFPKEGERVIILTSATDTLSWFKVQRKDSIQGWVFADFVAPIQE